MKEQTFLKAFKALLKAQSCSSQSEITTALAKQGFDNISQAKVSRTLTKLGAIKNRNVKNQVVYMLQDELAVPKSKQAIHTVVNSVKHNKMQIIIKTGIGVAPLIARMLDIQGESIGVLGTLVGDDTIFIAPVDVNEIGEITESIRILLDVE
ncbi:ArgR family transcriptional regulator [Thalassotalea sp. 42_200_T64]|nr:ArgR family transcriptional regulator [Thalassotalea sp. 42_200_T64]